MNEPFFEFIKRNNRPIFGGLYGLSEEEKTYDRIVYKLLPEPEKFDTPLIVALENRVSAVDFSQEQLSLEKFSTLVKHSIGFNKKSKGLKGYNFPSAGGFYPIETYFLVHNVKGLESGVYHYSSGRHAVAKLNLSYERDIMELNKDHSSFFKTLPSVLIYMTMVKGRITYHYGNLSYALSLAEVGHRGQNISLCASALDLAACPIGGGNYKKANKLIGVDGEGEHFIYAFAVGCKK